MSGRYDNRRQAGPFEGRPAASWSAPPDRHPTGFRRPVRPSGPAVPVCRRAALALALGAVSVVFSWTGVAVIAGIAALVLGRGARRELAAAAGTLSGERMVLAALVLAGAGLVLAVGFALVVTLAAVGG